MRIKNRLTSYPILDDFGDDYIDSYFHVVYDVQTRFSEIYGNVHCELNNQGYVFRGRPE